MKIEKNVSMPSFKRYGDGRPMKYPFPEMEVGDSILVEPAKRKKSTSPGVASARKWGKKHGVVFIARKQECGNMRIWRIA